jgi:hypothetical protein
MILVIPLFTPMVLTGLLVKWTKAIRLVAQVWLAPFLIWLYMQPIQHEFRNFQQHVGG